MNFDPGDLRAFAGHVQWMTQPEIELLIVGMDPGDPRWSLIRKQMKSIAFKTVPTQDELNAIHNDLLAARCRNLCRRVMAVQKGKRSVRTYTGNDFVQRARRLVAKKDLNGRNESCSALGR